jgi:uncharacterized protein (DUF2147 family)
MTRAAFAAAFALLLSLTASVAIAAPSPAGTWQIISDRDGKPRALIRVSVAGGTVSGVLIASLRGEDPNKLCDKCKGDNHDKKIIGMRVLWGLEPTPGDPLSWDRGQVLDPDSGNVYSAKMSESADGKTLTVRGFIGLALLGRTQTWKRQN